VHAGRAGGLGRSLASTPLLRLAPARVLVCRGIGTVVDDLLAWNPAALYGLVAYLALAGRGLLNGGAHEEERHQGQAYHGQLKLSSVAHFRSLNGWRQDTGMVWQALNNGWSCMHGRYQLRDGRRRGVYVRDVLCVMVLLRACPPYHQETRQVSRSSSHFLTLASLLGLLMTRDF
jgi:hypothetical protein